MVSSLTPAMALVRRELLTQFRHPRTFALTGVFVAVVCVLFALWWPEDSDLGRSGSQLFFVLSMVQLGACALLAPGLTCISVFGERQGGTLDLLRMTGVGLRGILAGKLLSVLGVFALMLLAAAPMIGSLFFLTGIDLDRALYELAYLVLTLLVYVLTGAACGAWFRTSSGALVGTYGSVLLLTFVGFALLIVAESFFSIRVPDWMAIVPFGPGIIVISFEQAMGEGAAFMAKEVGFLVVIALVAWRVALRRMANPRVTRHVPVRRKTESRRLMPFYLIDPWKPKPPLKDGRNPFLWRELRWGFLGHATGMIRQFYGTLFFFGGLLGYMVPVQGLRSESAVWAFYGAQMGLPVVLAVFFSSSLFTRDRETGEWDFLRSTLVPARGIFFGKVLSVIVRVTPVWLASALVLMMLGAIGAVVSGHEFVLVVVASIFAIALNVVFTVALCAVVGVLLRSTGAVLGVSLLATVFVQFAGWGGAVVYADWLFRQGMRGVQIDYTWVLEAQKWSYVFSPGGGFYFLLESGPSIGMGWLWWIVSVGGYTALTGLLLRFGAGLFDRRLMRAGR